MILLVDDSERRQELAGFLGDRYVIQLETEIDSALEAIQRQFPELVVCSETVPRTGVMSLITRLRTEPVTDSVPVILLTDPATKTEVSTAQIDRNVIKLIRDEQVLAHVERLVEVGRLREELRASQTRFSLATGAVSLGAWEFDLTTQGFHCDAFMAERLGICVSPELESPFSWKSVKSLSDGERVDAEFRNACATNSRFETELGVVRTDDSLIWLRCCGEILVASGRRRMVGIVQDVTERKHVAQSLSTNEARLSDLVRNANSAIIRWSCDGTITHFNEFAQAFFGYRDDEVIGRHVSMLVPERESTGRDLSRLAQDVVDFPERYENYVNENIRRDGRRAWMSWTNRAIRDERGRVLEIIAVGNDITDRKLAALTLKEREVQLEATVNSLIQGVLVCNLSGYLVHWNQAALEMHGIPDLMNAQEQRERFEKAFELTSLDGDVLPFEQSPLPRILRGEEFQDLELRIRHSREEWTRVFSYRGKIIRRDDGEPFLALLVISDVTEQRRAADALLKSEERFALAVAATQEGVWDWNLETDEVFYSRRWKEMLGYTDSEIEPHVSAWKRLLHPEDRERTMQLVAAVHRGEAEYSIEFRLRHKDGHYVEIMSRGLPVRPKSGGPFNRLVGTHQDLTERKRYEAALRQSEQRLAIAASGTRIAMFDWNVDTGNALWTDQAPRLLGIATPQEPSTTTTSAKPIWIRHHYLDWATRVHPEDLPRLEEEVKRCLAENRSFEAEYRVVWPDESIHWIASRGVFQRETETHLVGIVMDVTDRVLSEKAIRDSEKLLAADVEAMTRLQKLSTLFLSDGNLSKVLREIVETAISISGADFGNIQLLDEKTSRLRIVAQHGLPKWWVDFWDQDYESLGACGAALRLGNRVIVDDVERSDIFMGTTALEVQRKAGIRAVQSTPLLNRAGKLIGMFSTHYRRPGFPDERVLPLLDLLARKSADIIEHAHYEACLREAKASAESANQAKSRFLAHMSHELRTPMNAILGMVDIALPRAINPTVKNCLGTVKESADLLLMILNDLLDSAKIESGKLELEAKSFSLRKMLEGVQKILFPRAREKGLTLSCWLSDATPDIWVGDQMRLQQVLLNIAGNAVKFTERGQVEIYVRTESQQGIVALKFEVRDTGIGIAASLLSQIFEPFVQADASMSRRFGGTGLGLAISKGLVEAMGGRLWAESEEGRGSEFHFLIPLSVGTELPVAPHPHVLSTAPTAALRILLVEDNPANQKLASYILQDRGHVVEVAGDGAEALRMTEKTRYDVILMDVQMPGMDGMTATAAIREREAGGDRVPIIAMTAHATRGYRERCLAAGMDDYLSKPFDAHEMIRLIENLASARPRHARFDDSEISTENSNSQSTSPSPTPPVIFDPELALKRCLNKPKMLFEMIQCFFREMDLLFPQMRTELREGRLEEVGRLGHRLKGTVIFLGAGPASEAARRVEQFCEPNVGTISEAEQAVAALEQQCIELKTVLRQHPCSNADEENPR